MSHNSQLSTLNSPLIPPGYKLTEVGVIPEDWEVKRIVDFASVGSGGTPSREIAAYWGGSIPWITTSQIEFGLITEADQFITDEGLRNSAAKLLPAGTLLLALYGQGKTRGKVGVLGIPAATNQACASITLHEGVSREFILHFLASRYEVIRNSSNSGSQENLNGNIVKGTLVAFPQLPEQCAIAEALSDVDALLVGLDRLIAKKRDLKQAAMQQLLTGQIRLPGEWIVTSGRKQTEVGVIPDDWEVKPLGAILNKGRLGGNYPNNNAEAEYPLMKMGNLARGYFDISKVEYITHDVTPEPIHQLARGDVLFNTRNTLELVGKSAIWRDELPVAYYNSNLMRLEFDPRDICSNEYASYTLNTTGSVARLRGLATGTTSVAAIYTRDLMGLQFIVPPKPEQAAIAAVLSDMDAELSALEARREKTRALKQAMMQELLTGKTRLVASPSNIVAVDFAANSKSVPARQPASKSHNWQINEAVVVAVLVKQFGSEQYPLGRKRCTKLSYLMHRRVEHVALGYLKKAAGPYNPAVKYKGPEGIAQKNGYIRPHTNGKFSGFVIAGKIAQAEGYFDDWYGLDVLTWLEQFRKSTNDELELLATVDMAVEDLRRVNLREGVEAVKSVIRNHPEWEAKLEREIFSDFNIARAIRRVNELFSRGDAP